MKVGRQGGKGRYTWRHDPQYSLRRDTTHLGMLVVVLDISERVTVMEVRASFKELSTTRGHTPAHAQHRFLASGTLVLDAAQRSHIHAQG
jgi:hypothetical protein